MKPLTAASVHEDLIHTRAELWMLDQLLARDPRRQVQEVAVVLLFTAAYGVLCYSSSGAVVMGSAVVAMIGLLALLSWLRRDIHAAVDQAEEYGLVRRRCHYLGEGELFNCYPKIRALCLIRLHMLRWASGETVTEAELSQVDRHLDGLAPRKLDALQRWYRDARARQRWHQAVVAAVTSPAAA